MALDPQTYDMPESSLDTSTMTFSTTCCISTLKTLLILVKSFLRKTHIHIAPFRASEIDWLCAYAFANLKRYSEFVGTAEGSWV